ncbi:guanine nucleotide-binding protein subunit gamma-1-like [Dermacentor albipictus]|uniref:guanine nucleotide-binding protein subunit gamma-1-like n=1 Tax=Dermacentor albipictus TaxID=60249 RepID=UPI0021555D1D
MPHPFSEMSNLQQQRKIVEQLRREAGLKRMEVSAAVEDLKKYIQDHESDDYLLVGFHSQKANPFREKSSCSLL